MSDAPYENYRTKLPGWPARLQADLAAAYVGLFKPDGTPDAATFRQHVKKTLYPQPYKRTGERQAWLKAELDTVLQNLNDATLTSDELD